MRDGASNADLAEIARKIEGCRATVIGDPVLDCYVYGTTVRVSREAPIPIVREDSRELRLGAAANTAANLALLGATTTLVGFVGDDGEADELASLAEARGIDASRLVRVEGARTVTKTRVLAGGLHTRKQQMLRLDRESDVPPTEEDCNRLVARAKECIGESRAVVISDYGHGVLTPIHVGLATHARKLGRIVVADSRRHMLSFRGITAVTPNEPEAEAALGVSLGTREASIAAARRLVEELDVDVVLLTRGREGMVASVRGREPVAIPAHGNREAVDVTGAGDTVVAAFGLALAVGADFIDAARLANIAASIVIRTVGTSPCTKEQLARELAKLR